MGTAARQVNQHTAGLMWHACHDSPRSPKTTTTVPRHLRRFHAHVLATTVGAAGGKKPLGNASSTIHEDGEAPAVAQ
jgi:hypothetical protein